MFVAGLTGGIGSGKTTFARLLAERGAEVLDADELGRSALEPGTATWHSVVAQFGDGILVPGTMDIDRKALAAVVFNDPKKLAALNAIVHPVIVSRIADTLEVLRGTDEIVVIDAALLVDLGLEGGMDAVIVVTAPENIRTKRLVRDRNMSVKQVQDRISAQASEELLREKADIWVDNSGDPSALSAKADEVWAKLVELRASGDN